MIHLLKNVAENFTESIVENGYEVALSYSAALQAARSVIHYLTYDERLQLLHDPSLGPIRCGISLVILLLGRRAVPPPSKYARFVIGMKSAIAQLRKAPFFAAARLVAA